MANAFPNAFADVPGIEVPECLCPSFRNCGYSTAVPRILTFQINRVRSVELARLRAGLRSFSEAEFWGVAEGWLERASEERSRILKHSG